MDIHQQLAANLPQLIRRIEHPWKDGGNDNENGHGEGLEIDDNIASPFMLLVVCERAFLDLSLFGSGETAEEEGECITSYLLQVARDLDRILSMIKKEMVTTTTTTTTGRRVIRVIEELCIVIGIRLLMVDVLTTLLSSSSTTTVSSSSTATIATTTLSSTLIAQGDINNSHAAPTTTAAALRNALLRVVDNQQKVRSKYVKPLAERAADEAKAILAYVDAHEALLERQYATTVLAIARLDTYARRVDAALSIAEGDEKVPGLCELFRQWREVLVADHRVLFRSQLDHTAAAILGGSSSTRGQSEESVGEEKGRDAVHEAVPFDLGFAIPPRAEW